MTYLVSFEVFESKGVFYNTFAYFLVEEREKLQNKYGNDWDNFVSEKEMKRIILSILNKDELRMSQIEKNRWRNKVLYTDFGKMSILKMFFDPELAALGLAVNKQKRNYK